MKFIFIINGKMIKGAVDAKQILVNVCDPLYNLSLPEIANKANFTLN